MKKRKNTNVDHQRKISDKVFGKKELSYKTALAKCEGIRDKISNLETIISDKSIIIPADKKGGQKTKKVLSTAELGGYKLQLKKEKLNLKRAEKDAKKEKATYKHNASVIAHQAKKFNAKIEGEFKAKREIEVRKEIVIGIIKKHKENGDPKFARLAAVVANGNLFRKEMDSLLKQEDIETFTTISGLSAVKSAIYRSVKDEFFGKADDGSDDDDDENAAPLVTA